MGVPAEQITATELKMACMSILGYEPHNQQRLIHESPARFIVAICGRRFGKSVAGAREIEAILCNPAMTDRRIWIVAPTYVLVDKIFREVWRDVVIGQAIAPGAIAKKSEPDRVIKTAWGTELIGKSADNPDSLVGDAVDLLVFDECAKTKVTVWEQYLRPTLTDRNGRALFLTTPEGRNWMYELYLRGQSDNPDWMSYRFPSSDNPYLDVTDIDEARKTLSDVTYRQEYLAQFVTFAGKVYRDFDISTHVISRAPDTFDAVIGGVDYGYNNPSALIVIGIRDKVCYVVDEVYKGNMLLPEIESNLKRLTSKWGVKRWFAEHKPEYNNPLSRAGINLVRAAKSVQAGIECVSGKITHGLFKVVSNCRNVITELDNYHYPKSRVGLKEEPVKECDHACDAIRYAIYTHGKFRGIKTGKIKGLY